MHQTLVMFYIIDNILIREQCLVDILNREA